jgi:hypothetical protein
MILYLLGKKLSKSTDNATDYVFKICPVGKQQKTFYKFSKIGIYMQNKNVHRTNIQNNNILPINLQNNITAYS